MALDITITTKKTYDDKLSVEQNYYNNMYFDGVWNVDEIVCDTTDHRFWAFIKDLRLTDDEKCQCTVFRIVDEDMLDIFPRGIYFDDSEEELKTRIRQKIEQGLTIIIKLGW